MKIDFRQRLKTLKGISMFEKSFESQMVAKAIRLADRKFSNLEELLAFLDESKVTFLQILEEEGVPLCLKDICVEALMLRNVSVSEELPGREDVVRYKLALAISDAIEPLSVKPSEVRLMQELIGHLTIGGPSVTGQAFVMLEGGEVEESDALEPPARLKQMKEPRERIPSRRN